MGFAEAGGVVFERDVALGVVDLETAEAVRVGKFAEGPELVVSERGLEFEFRFEECHGTSIAERRNVGTFARLNVESSRLGLRRLTLRRREEGPI